MKQGTEGTGRGKKDEVIGDQNSIKGFCYFSFWPTKGGASPVPGRTATATSEGQSGGRKDIGDICEGT